MTLPRPTPPRGTTRAPAGERPANQINCPGCGDLIDFKSIACPPCWRTVPGTLKAELTNTAPTTGARKRVVARMRAWLEGRDAS